MSPSSVKISNIPQKYNEMQNCNIASLNMNTNTRFKQSVKVEMQYQLTQIKHSFHGRVHASIVTNGVRLFIWDKMEFKM